MQIIPTAAIYRFDTEIHLWCITSSISYDKQNLPETEITDGKDYDSNKEDVLDAKSSYLNLEMN